MMVELVKCQCPCHYDFSGGGREHRCSCMVDGDDNDF